MELTSNELREKIENGEKMVVDFWAAWCGPCRMVKPIFEKVGEELKSENSDVHFYSVDVETHSEIARELGIRNIPTIKSFNGGKEVETSVGVIQETKLKDMAMSLLNG
jgi:thioredoxin 1